MPQVRPRGQVAGAVHSETALDDGKQGTSRFLSNIFDSYAAACGGSTGSDVGAPSGCGGPLRSDTQDDSAFQEGIQRVEEQLLSMQGEAAACLICLEDIDASDPIWHCIGGCYEMVHLVCIQSWARQQLATAQAKAEQLRLHPDRAAAEARSAACWGCPKCRREYSGSAIPSAYHCFCGKVQDPPFDPWNAPHSCGERCERASKGCGHPCMLLCHPGPCPPCPRIVHTACYCGAVSAERRCGRHEFSCGGVCNQWLPCGHICPETCHEGPCPPCGLMSSVRCRCGSACARLPCSQQGVFQCGKVCGRLLDCGRHTCQLACHAGRCGGCELAGVRSCPCGKQVVPDAPCDLVVPPCGATCDKLLSCGIHRCVERCHAGPCPQTCRGLVEKTCACGKTTKVVQCREPVKCERRCTAMRSCGRHQCKKRCCSGDCPPCEEVCGRRLKCGNHRCPAPCHAGPCAPCPLSAHIGCACGLTSYSVPCGREKLAQPPPCKHACPVRPLCRHADALPRHRCHFGPCPGPLAAGAPLCPLPCATPHPRCGHPCQSPCCHDPLPTPVADYQPPSPPAMPLGGQESGAGASSSGGSKKRTPVGAELPPAVQAAKAAAALAASLPRCGRYLSYCPPCQVALEVPCSSAAPFSCGVACGRPLPCTNHTCSKPCHDPSMEPCEACTAPCTQQRCEHPCQLGCHPGDCPPCRELVTRACHCGKTSLRFECWEAAAGIPPDRLRCAKVCHRALQLCPHLCQETCHSGACPKPESCSEEVTVRCACRRIKRKEPCSTVQSMLQAETGSRSYDAATPLRLLPCDAECATLAAAAEAAGKKGAATAVPASSTDVSAAVKGASMAAPAGVARTAGKPGAAAAEEQQGTAGEGRRKGGKAKAREEERQRQRQLQEQKARRQLIIRATVLSLVVLVALLLGRAVVRLARLADEKAQGAWGTEQDL
ncbi:hypothetical protein N2152v2_006981 [Parachlorella kessleri]